MNHDQTAPAPEQFDLGPYIVFAIKATKVDERVDDK